MDTYKTTTPCPVCGERLFAHETIGDRQVLACHADGCDIVLPDIYIHFDGTE